MTSGTFFRKYALVYIVSSCIACHFFVLFIQKRTGLVLGLFLCSKFYICFIRPFIIVVENTETELLFFKDDVFLSTVRPCITV